MFANDKSIDNLQDLFKEFRKYIELQGECLKLDTVEKLTVLLSTLTLILHADADIPFGGTGSHGIVLFLLHAGLCPGLGSWDGFRVCHRGRPPYPHRAAGIPLPCPPDIPADGQLPCPLIP